MGFIDMTGFTTGRLSVVSRAENKKDGTAQWNCQCSCGKMLVKAGADLRRKVPPASCGCLRNEQSTKHRMCFTPEYKTWQSMKDRCNNPNNHAYASYGGRGITVCKQWSNDFLCFFSDMGKRPKGKTMDRIDNDKGYSPENCRWASVKTQAENRRSSRIININGVEKTATQWARENGLSDVCVFKRLLSGDTGTDIIRPIRSKRRNR